MLRVFTNMKQLSYAELKSVYAESLHQAAQRDYPDRADALLQAEMDFYEYLRNSFFLTKGACLCLWMVDDRPVSVLRLEPYRDGVLLTGLETDPTQRGRGFAKCLMKAALDDLSRNMIVYSHIDNENIGSITVHKKCGFEKLTNFAVYLDGSASSKASTYIRKFVNN